MYIGTCLQVNMNEIIHVQCIITRGVKRTGLF